TQHLSASDTFTSTGAFTTGGSVSNIAFSSLSPAVVMVPGPAEVSASLTGALEIPIANVEMSPGGVQNPAPLTITATAPGSAIVGTATEGAVDASGKLLVSDGARTVNASANASGVFTLAVPKTTAWILTAANSTYGSLRYPQLVAAGTSGTPGPPCTVLCIKY